MLDKQFFHKNRQALATDLKGGLVVVAGYSLLQRSLDMAHSFEQEANFWYLCGIEDPDWTLVIDGSVKGARSYLIAPNVSEHRRLFDGGLSWELVQEISGVDAVVSRDDGDVLLRDLAKKHHLVYTIGGDPHATYYDFVVNPAQKQLEKRLERIFTDVRDCRKELASLRAIKHPEEIKAIKKAIKVTADAFENVLHKINHYSHEYEIEADFTHYFRSHGAKGHAYDPIIASGYRACTLHYSQNNAKLTKKQLVLLDVGARIDGYAADITRTYARGVISKRQQQIHEAVEAAHHDIINFLMPGLLVEEYMQRVDERMKQALIDVKLMNDVSGNEAYRAYFPHAISHGLGIDVHDSLGGPRSFEPGMVLTVEPGIYIPEEGIGVRIEDDILITDNGHQNLSKSLSTAVR